MAKKDFFLIRNESNETAVIDITGVIGFDWWEDEEDKPCGNTVLHKNIHKFLLLQSLMNIQIIVFHG
jgi:hypothetical protein